MSTPRGQHEGQQRPIRRSSWVYLGLALLGGIVSVIFLIPVALGCIADAASPSCTMTPGSATVMLAAGLVSMLACLTLLVRGLRAR